MARKGMSGQLNMFDFFSSLDAGAPGEVEMVSLVPDFEEEPEIVVEEVTQPEVEERLEVVVEPPVPETEPEVEMEVKPVLVPHEDATVTMSRSYEVDGIKVEIAYINYNKVRITKGDETPIMKEFTSTKEAVDYYVEQMQELEADE